MLMEVLWYIDRHHHLLSERSTASVPTVFKQFQGYNKPELSKHQKRSQSNLSSITLEHHARTLGTCGGQCIWPESCLFIIDIYCKANLTSMLSHVELSCQTWNQEKIFLKCMFDNSCYDPIERLYYSAGYPPICVYYGEEQTQSESDINPQLYPQCKNCKHKPPVKRN